MKKMTIRELDSLISKLEGRNKHTHIGNIREIRAIICDLIYKNPEILELMLKAGRLRAKRL